LAFPHFEIELKWLFCGGKPGLPHFFDTTLETFKWSSTAAVSHGYCLLKVGRAKDVVSVRPFSVFVK